MKTLKTMVLASTLAASAAALRAAGTTTADFLKVSPDSRSAALGGTGAADASNGFAAFHNPALPAADRARMRLSAGQTQWILGTQVGHYAASFRREKGDGAWAFGLALSQWSAPSFQTTDANGNSTGKASYAAQSAGVSLSRAWGRFSLGAGVKRISQGFEGGVSSKSQSTAWDAGAFIRGEENRWTAGAALANAGAALDGDKLPTSIRAGLELRPGDGRWAWSAEALHAQGAPLSVNLGGGFSPVPGLTLRAGYDGRVAGSEYAGLTSGLGVTRGDFSFDYAFSPFGELGNAQRISASWAYGGSPRKSAGPRARRAARGGEVKFSSKRRYQ